MAFDLIFGKIRFVNFVDPGEAKSESNAKITKIE